MQDFKFWYLNCKAIDTTFLYWSGFTGLHFFFPNYFFSKNQHSFDSANLRTFILYWQIWIKINIKIFFWTIFGLRLMCVLVLHVSLNEVPKVNWEFPASIYPIRLSWSFRNWLSCPSQSPAKDLAQETEKNLDKIQTKRE